MERVLHQDEIDSLFRAARGVNPGMPRRQRPLARCDFRQAGQITRDQARAVGGLHESFARNLGHSLSAYLRARLEATLVSIEQLGFGEFMQRLPEISYVASLAVAPVGANAAMQLDLALAYPMLDLILGGNGTATPSGSDITEIEEQILESILSVITRELQLVWQPVLDLVFTFERRQPMAQIFRLMPPNEKIMALSFEVHLGEVRSMLNLIFPAVVSTALLRKLSEAWVYRRGAEAPDVRPQLRRQLLGAKFSLEMVLPPAPMPMRELLDLRVGQVLTFPHAADRPAHLKVAGRKAFEAQAIRHRHFRAALIHAVHPLGKPLGGQ